MAALPVLGCIRITEPRDPLTADARGTLEALTARWGAAYRIGYDGHRWQASRKDGRGETLRGLTPDDLTAGMRADAGSTR